MAKRKKADNKKGDVVTMGRDKILMSDFIAEFEKQFGNIFRTCLKTGVGRTTYYEWRERDEDFKKVTDEITHRKLEDKRDAISAKLEEKAIKGNVPSMIFWLKSRHKDYQEKLKLEGDVNLGDRKLSPAEQLLLNKAIDYGFKRKGISKNTKKNSHGSGVSKTAGKK